MNNRLKFTLDKKVVLAASPIMIAYLALGLPCGVLAGSVGLSAVDAGLLSLFVFAGSGQFIALAMIGSGAASIASIVLTTFIVNLRHLLYSSTLVRFIAKEHFLFHCAFSQEITDETFAVNETRFSAAAAGGEPWTTGQAQALATISHLSWIFANIAGQILGSAVDFDPSLVGYTLTAMFIGLWSFHFNVFRKVMVGIFAGVLGLWLSTFLHYKLHVVVATVTAALVGLVWEKMAGQPDGQEEAVK